MAVELNPVVQKETVIDNISYVCPTWDQMGIFNFNLAKQIIESGQTFDRIVAVARGGITWSKDLADALKISKISFIQIARYTAVNKFGEAKIIKPLTDAIDGEKVLLFDEVVQSGGTIGFAWKYLRSMNPESLKTAALCCKSFSVAKPDFYAFSTPAWVVFPHSIREFIEESVLNWNVPLEETKRRLREIGIPPEQIEFYCSLTN